MPLHVKSKNDEESEEPETSSISVPSSSSLLGVDRDVIPVSPREYEITENEEKRYRLNSDHFVVGQRLDVLDSANCWSEAVVVKVCRTTTRIFVTYSYWEDRWDEWLEETEIVTRVAPFRTHTYFEGGELKLRQRVEVKDTTGKWLEAHVIGGNADSVKIHYFRFASTFDEWLPRSSERVRPFGQQKNIKKNGKVWKIPALPGSSPSASSSEDRTRQIGELSERYTHYTGALKLHNLSVVPVQGDGNWYLFSPCSFIFFLSCFF